MKPGRNDKCPCGSGRKYKSCCLGKEAAGAAADRVTGVGRASPRPLNSLNSLNASNSLRADSLAADDLLAMFKAGRFAELEARLHALLGDSSQSGSGFLWGLLGASLQAQGKDGLAALQRASALSPQDFDIQTVLGRALVERGRFAEAADAFRQALAIVPENLAAQFTLGDTLRLLERFQEAEEILRGVVLKAPDFVEALVSLADTLAERGLADEAETVCRRAVALAPEYATTHFCLGNILRNSGRLGEARDCFLASLRAAPNSLPVLGNLGNVLQELGDFVQAEDCYRRALKLNPAYATAGVNLGRLCVEQNRFVDAEAAYREVLKAQPKNAEILERLGGVLTELGDSDAARKCYLDALAVAPERISTRLALATAVLPVIAQSSEESAAVGQDFARALDELADWLHADRARAMDLASLASAQQPFSLAYRDGNHVDQLARYGDLIGACLHRNRPASPVAAAACPPREKPRLLIVSHHIRRHSVWDIVLRGLLLDVDRTRFEILVYHLGNVEDEETVFARELVDGWRDRQTISDPGGWLAAAAADAPDVIFYPEIGMSSLCYFLAAHRLAPLQVASWGHPISTGLATIDLFLSGELLEAADADSHYRERLIRLPGTGCCTAPLPLAAEPIPEVEAHLRGMDGPRFVIAQRALKFDPRDDALYARIAAATGASVFILLRDPISPWATEQVMARLEAAFREQGLDPGRHLLSIPWLAPAQFLALLDACDVYLDCPAFSGYTTAWQALHRGLPIVALEGRYMRQRLASGLLRKAGLPDSIARSADDYVAIAAGLGKESRDVEPYQARRAAIIAAAPSVDGDVSVVRAFERCLLAELDAIR
ncbi:MAG: tetratricopeptide repeat protein [Candidatus Accumulibacter appositus]|uniref:protein O-GlcNAc transferase n=1 Tax=Candidatus Accumulibacter appositus TaxID=1454003 RepID=A0A011QJ19_9PROT|nr:MAG: tetratricopeptide repeat protein [Candidatus Accumulibacter appositus]